MAGREEVPAQAHASGLTDYELQRAAHVRRNMEYMTRLGIVSAAEAMGMPQQGRAEGAPKQAESKRRKKVTSPHRAPASALLACFQAF